MEAHAIDHYCSQVFNDTLEGVVDKIIEAMNLSKDKRIKHSLGHLTFLISCEINNIIFIVPHSISSKSVFDAIEYQVECYLIKRYSTLLKSNNYDRLLNDIEYILYENKTR